MPDREIPMTAPDDGRLATVAPIFADLRVRQYSELAGLLIYRADLATGEIVWTPGLLWELGYRPEDVSPTVEWWIGSMHPDDVTTVTGFLAEALEGKRAEWELHYRLRRADGSWARVEGRARLLRDAEGRPVSTEGVVRDVSAQHAAETALRERETAFRLLADDSRELICRHAPNGTYTYVSPAVREIAGWEPEDLLGRNPYEFFHPDDHSVIQEQGHAVALNGQLGRVGVVCRFRGKNGVYVWLDTLTRPIMGADGSVVELQTSSRDVTERRLLEDRLARSQQLEAIGVLAGGIAHDFNNLMAIVLGNVELLQSLPAHADSRELLADVHAATQRAAALTRQLLIIGRRERATGAVMDLAATVSAPADIITAATPPGEPVTASRAARILVVDDEPAVLAVARRLLERNGYDVTTAADGADAMAQFAQGLRPDLLLTDVMMPGMSGRALAESVLARDPTMPVVFMSGFARDGLLHDGMIGQEHPLVRKPFALDDLLGVVQGALQHRAARPSAQVSRAPSSSHPILSGADHADHRSDTEP